MSDEYYATACTDRYQLLKDFAKKNRKKATDAERILWENIRANKVGVKFRRQHPVLDFIADFVCLSEKLIIEVDGGYHNSEDQIYDDEVRSERLNNMGYVVLRYSNEDVIHEIDNVIHDIKNKIKGIHHDE